MICDCLTEGDVQRRRGMSIGTSDIHAIRAHIRYEFLPATMCSVLMRGIAPAVEAARITVILSRSHNYSQQKNSCSGKAVMGIHRYRKRYANGSTKERSPTESVENRDFHFTPRILAARTPHSATCCSGITYMIYFPLSSIIQPKVAKQIIHCTSLV